VNNGKMVKETIVIDDGTKVRRSARQCKFPVTKMIILYALLYYKGGNKQSLHLLM